MMVRRVIEPEVLDTLSEEEARPAVRDLARINRWLGGHAIARRLVGDLTSREESFTLLDVGAASGDIGAAIARHRPQARVTLLDWRMEHLRQAPGVRVIGDAFRLPFRERSFDFVFCSLFLHHFDDRSAARLVRSFHEAARRGLIVVDLERTVQAKWFLPLTRAVFGWDRVTVYDGRLSVGAAFTRTELEAVAREAGLRDFRVRRHTPWSRLSLVAMR